MPKRKLDLTKVAPISRVVELKSVCWREISAKRLIELTEVPSDLLFFPSHQAVGIRDLEANEILVIAEFRVKVKTQDEKMNVADVNGTLSLRYAVREGGLKEFDPELVQDFADTNGIYNAWPYWREALQNTAARIGLPGVIAPVFRLVGSPAKTVEK